MTNERGARLLSRSAGLGGLLVSALLSWSSRARAAEPAVWYRAGQSCPDGASFLERLERRGVHARLAQVGDQIDFVVTLGPSGEGSSGRLERQTASGTIAIRQVEDAKCEAVAEVLALTLSLALDHEAEPNATAEVGAPATAPASSSTAAPAPAEAPVSAPARAAEPAPRRTLTRAPVARRAAVARKLEDRAAWSLGARASATDLFGGPWLFGAGVFGDWQAPASFALARMSVRTGLNAGFRPRGNADVKVWLGAGRLEGCPVGLELGRLDLRPCGALDIGAIGASAAGTSDAAWWLAAAAHVRAALVWRTLALEAELGGVVPLTRYEVESAGRDRLEATKIIGLSCALGARLRLE